jgi:hypothetical protein
MGGESADDGHCSFIRFLGRDFGRGVAAMDGNPEGNNPGLLRVLR